MSGSLFELRPRVGDLWEFKTPNKQKKRKIVGSIQRQQHNGKDGQIVVLPRVMWKRLPKGRYSSLRVKWLLKYGWLVTRKALATCPKCNGSGSVKGNEVEDREVNIEVDLDYNCPRCHGDRYVVTDTPMNLTFRSFK
jgi:hypothetical protein